MRLPPAARRPPPTPVALALLFGALALAACGGDDLPPPGVAPTETPAADADGYGVASRRWVLVADGLTSADPLTVTVTAPAATRFVDAWVDGGAGQRLVRARDGSFTGTLAGATTGEHVLRFAADGSPHPFAARPVSVSAALYVVVSTDWDTADNPDVYLANMELLRKHHPSLVYSQFFAPYALTDPSVPQARKDHNVAWIEQQRDHFGDEIGVHIHPYCNFVTTVSDGGKAVACRTMPSFSTPNGDPSGYSVLFAAYTPGEQLALLAGARALFEQRGLGTPTSFRAGGWTSDLVTLGALAKAGYTVESSAFPPSTIQSAWGGQLLGTWTAKAWSRITTTSQPYYPSTTDVQGPEPPPRLPVLEVPDNGCLVDYMTGAKMAEVLAANWPGSAPLPSPRVFQIGLHPTDFGSAYLVRMEEALTAVDAHLASRDAGPLRYARLTDLRKVFRQP